VAAIRSFPRPTNVVEMQAFLGLFNYYRRFMQAAARIVRLLTDALRAVCGHKLAWCGRAAC
jgi:hypothetical protein